MTNNQQTDPQRDEMLWGIAKKRAKFKKSLLTYLIMNAFFWAIWFFSNDDFAWHMGHFPWPLWVTFGWGIGIAFQYSDAYLFHKGDAVQKEYEKLKNNS